MSVTDTLTLEQLSVQYASWDKWDPKIYLQTYFATLGEDSHRTFDFLVEELSEFRGYENLKILDFGSGPTIFGSIPASKYASEIHVADYLESNLIEIEKWTKNQENKFCWDNAIKYVLKKEHCEHVGQLEIAKRELLIKKKITKMLRCDASLSFPLFHNERYPLVLSIFCADSATSSRDVWKAYMQNIFNLIQPHGTILIASLRKCSFYKVGNHSFPCANVDDNDLYDVLKEGGFDRREIRIEVNKVPGCAIEGFDTIMLAKAKKI